MNDGLALITNEIALDIHNAISILQKKQDMQCIIFLKQFTLEQLIYARDISRIILYEKIKETCDNPDDYMPDAAVAATYLYVAKNGFKRLSDNEEADGKFAMTCCHSSKNFVLFLAPQSPPSPPQMATAK
jgi:hypothetical protein